MRSEYPNIINACDQLRSHKTQFGFTPRVLHM